jgi:hypothetical protein
VDNLAKRLAKGETPTPEEYEQVAKQRQVPVDVQQIKAVHGQKCEQCGSPATVFECFLPDLKRNIKLCLSCQDKIKSKAIDIAAVGVKKTFEQ